jgi:hypothetical protein
MIASLLIVMGGISAGAQSSTDSAGTVVAAWAITNGSPRADTRVSTSADKRRFYDVVETYVWSALPPDARARISRLELFVAPNSVEDASDGTAAENDDGTSWTLSLDYGEAESALIRKGREDVVTFDEVIAHELGHVLSLNQDQRTDEEDLDTYADDESPFTETAYLNRFYQDFWNGNFQSRDDFVTEYAATDPVEDFAESFAYFVLSPKPTDGTEKAEKLRFFYDYPELVKDREFMRRNLSSVTGSPRPLQPRNQ